MQRPQSYAARAALLAGERKGILQAKFGEARAMTFISHRFLFHTDRTDFHRLLAGATTDIFWHAEIAE